MYLKIFMNSLHPLEEITGTLASHSVDPKHCQTQPNFALTKLPNVDC